MLMSLKVVKHSENPPKSYETYVGSRGLVFPSGLLDRTPVALLILRSDSGIATRLPEEVTGQCLVFLTLIC